MKNHIYLFVVAFVSIFGTSCDEKKGQQAIQYVNNIWAIYHDGDYTTALQKIDSIQILFPDAFQEIKEGLALQQEVRRSSDQKQIAECNFLLSIYQTRIDSIKDLFKYQKDKEDDSGIFVAKAIAGNNLTVTMLRAGVSDHGALYLESVYLGGQKHNKVEISTKDKRAAESLPIDDDGLNYKFSNLGKQYEIIKITSFHDNGLTNFIIANASNPLTVTLKGKSTTSYSLSSVHTKAIVDSYQLSLLLTDMDSLEIAKDKAVTRIKYLDSKGHKRSGEGSSSSIHESELQ